MSVSTSRLLSLSLSFSSLFPSLPLLSSHSCLSLVWWASPFARERKDLVSCLYMTCTAAARSTAQSDRSTSPPILCGYWYACRPIRDPLFLFNKWLQLSLPRVLTNEVLDLHEAGDHNNFIKNEEQASDWLVRVFRYLHNIGGDVARSDWAALLAAVVQIAYRHDTRPFLPLAKGLARQTSLSYHLSSLVSLCSAPPLFSLVSSLSPSLFLVCLTAPLPLSLLPLF